MRHAFKSDMVCSRATHCALRKPCGGLTMAKVEFVGIRNGKFIIRAGEAVIIGGVRESSPLYHIFAEHVVTIDLLDSGRESLESFELSGGLKASVKVSEHLKKAGWTTAITGGIATVGLLIATPFYPPAACFLEKTVKITLVGIGIGVVAGTAEKLLSRVKYVRISVKTKAAENLSPIYSDIADLSFIARMPEKEYRAFLARMQPEDDD